MWSSQAIQLEGCGGPRFQMNVMGRRRDLALAEADLFTFCERMPTLNPEEAQVFCNRDEWQDVKDEVWEDACRSLQQCSRLTSFDFYAPYCRPGYQDTKIQTFVRHAPHLQKLKIHDGLYGYTESFLAMSHHLQNLRQLSLKNVCFRGSPSRECCQALADLIRAMPQLERFELANIHFTSPEDWKLIEEALVGCDYLEDLDVYRITVDGANLVDTIQRSPVWSEKAAVLQCLRTQNLLRPYSTTSFMDATLQVRSQGRLQLADIRPDPRKYVDALSTVTDRFDFIFQFFRHEIDPSFLVQLCRVH